jgi:hypothetical protein
MKIIVLLALLCTFSEVALAQAPECQSIPKASDRLACYDRAAPPKAVGKRAASKTSAAPDKQAAPATPAENHLPGMLARGWNERGRQPGRPLN